MALSGVVTTPSGPRTDTTPRDMTAALCPMHAASARTGMRPTGGLWAEGWSAGYRQPHWIAPDPGGALG